MILWRFCSPDNKTINLYEFQTILTPSNFEGNAEMAKRDGANLKGGYDKLEQSPYIYKADLFAKTKDRSVHYRNWSAQPNLPGLQNLQPVTSYLRWKDRDLDNYMLNRTFYRTDRALKMKPEQFQG